jgi:glutathione synthase/RimK-type ligase-like ATP-grasp enzyme
MQKLTDGRWSNSIVSTVLIYNNGPMKRAEIIHITDIIARHCLFVMNLRDAIGFCIDKYLSMLIAVKEYILTATATPEKEKK